MPPAVVAPMAWLREREGPRLEGLGSQEKERARPCSWKSSSPWARRVCPFNAPLMPRSGACQRMPAPRSRPKPDSASPLSCRMPNASEGRREAPLDRGKGLMASTPRRRRERLPSEDSSPSTSSEVVFRVSTSAVLLRVMPSLPPSKSSPSMPRAAMVMVVPGVASSPGPSGLRESWPQP